MRMRSVANSNDLPPLIIIVGPTAVGKTELSLHLARAVGGEVISADSRQVYRGMDIGTGKDLAEYRTDAGLIPYHLIDIADPQEIYTLHHYLNDFYLAFREVSRRGRLPVMVGGTGLYIEAVLKEYRLPNVPEDVALRARFMEMNKEELLRLLAEADPDLYAKADLTSKKRIVRALEVAKHAGRGPARRGGTEPPRFAGVETVGATA